MNGYFGERSLYRTYSYISRRLSEADLYSFCWRMDASSVSSHHWYISYRLFLDLELNSKGNILLIFISPHRPRPVPLPLTLDYQGVHVLLLHSFFTRCKSLLFRTFYLRGREVHIRLAMSAHLSIPSPQNVDYI